MGELHSLPPISVGVGKAKNQGENFGERNVVSSFSNKESRVSDAPNMNN